MASNEASLHSLEALMDEFFCGNADNNRKREIEHVLHNFGQQSGAWHHCVYFLSNSRNHYVLMYAISIFENLINKQWIGTQPSDKTEIRSFLKQYLLSQHKALPAFVRNKLAKVIVDMGRLDWPHFYPNFLSDIMELIQQPSNTSLGLIMLQTTSEELASPREDLSIARRTELHRLLLHEVPAILCLLTQLLDRILDKHRRLASTVTPPPSPTHGVASTHSASPTVSNSSTLSLCSTSPLTDAPHHVSNPLVGRLLNQSPKSRQNFGHPLPSLDPDAEEISCLTLKCLAHLFSWIPLSSTIKPALLGTVFYFAEFGCNGISGGGGGSVVCNPDLGVLAMTCINELLSKNCVPQEYEEYLLKLFQQTFQLLQRITKDSASSSDDHLSELDDSYLNKFTEFLHLFVSIHLRRFENSSLFPILELLTLLYKYTFHQPQNEGFFNCLDTWSVFLEYLTSKVSSARRDKLAEAEATVSRYKDVLMLLLNDILKKIQFHHNHDQLEELDDSDMDDNAETEWQAFQRNCLEIVAKLAELLPAEAFTALFPLFSKYIDVYLGLGQFITKTAEGTFHMDLGGEMECRQLHCSLRDLSTIERALGRLVEHFIGEVNFGNRFSDGEAIVDRFCHVALFGTQMKLYSIKSTMPSLLQPDLIEVHAQALAALQAYCHWLSQFYLESQRQQQHHDKFATLVSTIINALIPLLSKEVPHRVSLPACHLLNSLTSTVRPSFFIALDKVQSLYRDISNGSLGGVPLEIQVLVFRSLSNALVLPWPYVSGNEQQWEMRSQNHLSLIKGLTSRYKEMTSSPGFSTSKELQQAAKPSLQYTLHILQDLVSAVAEDQVTKTKVILYHSIQDVVQLTLTVFPLYANEPDAIDAILGFLLALFQSLKIQIGTAVTEQIVQRLMSIFTRDQLYATIVHESSLGSRVVEKFLRLLQLLVQEPAASFKAFLPGIISLSMDQLYPILAERQSPDIKTEFFELLHQLLLHNWRYFFRTSLLAKMSAGEEQVENQSQFVSMLQAFGQSFLQPDITIFRQNLEALENLNSKCKLYQKGIFRSNMLLQFVNVLTQALVHRSHDLLQDEIIITIYNMAAVDWDQFFASFLPQFLVGCEGLTENQKSELRNNFRQDKDLPSFTHGIQRFIADLRYYRLCNSSLPPGTVKF
ncbi:exportin-6 isoform X2 [Nematostella vectensis]|uniref:exportin-6 isoform X2 n=1 Tax=Nematostella vectensis TaxID=45351 RepID=UPI0020778015|nr:exportin-6 isoform X2 [Nematostella vectensis]